MASTVTQTTIINKALTYLGKTPLLSSGQTSPASDVMSIHYESVRDAVLEDQEWRFATKRVDLTPDPQSPPHGFEFAYNEPSDSIRILTVKLQGARDEDPDIHWESESGQIVCNQGSAIAVKYTWRVTDSTRFSPGFVEAFATRLAADLAVSLTKSTKLRSELQAEYMVKLNEAATVNGLQGKSRRFRSRQVLRNYRFAGAESIGRGEP